MTVFSLQGRTALVTGASSGIGAGIAAALDRAGARVALAARTGDALSRVAAGLTNDPVVIETDLSDPAAPDRLASDAEAQLGRVDVLVNNAALGGRMLLRDVDAEVIDGMHAVNVRAPLLLIAALAPGMTARGRGSIISLSSVSGVVGTPHRNVYAATKGAIDAATRSLASELGPQGIRVNSVAPGVVEMVEAQTPLRRWSTVADVADVVVFLASDAARFITGETICVDGGMARTLDLFSGAT